MKNSKYAQDIEKLARDNDEKILAFPINENGENLVSLRDNKKLFFDDEKNKYLVRFTVAKLVELAVENLEVLGYSLYFCDAYRPISIQKQYWDESLIATNKKYPKITDIKEIERLTARFTAPVARAQHCTGGSIDVLLYNLKTNEIVDDFDESEEVNYSELMYTDNPLVSVAEQMNRKLLKNMLEDVGFINYPLEWWHYSYGNAEWAIYKNEAFAIYGPIEY